MFFMVLFFNKPGVYQFSIPQQVVCFMLGEILLISTIFLFRDKLKLSRFFTKNENKKVLIGLGLLFIVQVLFVSQFYKVAPFDAKTVYIQAQNKELVSSFYFSEYPNNLFLLFFEHATYQVNMFLNTGIDTYFVLVVINILAVDLSIYLIYLITRKVFSRRLSWYALLLAVLLFGMMPWFTVVYSDTLSMPMGLSVFYLYLKIKEQANNKGKILYAVLLGMCAYLGFLIKPSGVFSGLAIIVVEVMMCNYKSLIKQTKKMVIVLCLSVAVLIGVFTVRLPFNYVVDHQQLVPYDENENFPFTHWMMLGLNENEFRGHTAYGMWTAEGFFLTHDAPGKKAKLKRTLGAIRQRLVNFGFLGYIKFLWNKAIWILGDGTFFWGNEGLQDEVTEERGIAQTIQNIVYSKGKNYGYYAYLLQTEWFIVFFALAMSLFSIKKYMNKNFLIISCTIFGSILFILLFEGRSRYLLNNLGFFIMIASVGMEKILTTLKKLTFKKHKLQKSEKYKY